MLINGARVPGLRFLPPRMHPVRRMTSAPLPQGAVEALRLRGSDSSSTNSWSSTC